MTIQTQAAPVTQPSQTTTQPTAPMQTDAFGRPDLRSLVNDGNTQGSGFFDTPPENAPAESTPPEAAPQGDDFDDLVERQRLKREAQKKLHEERKRAEREKEEISNEKNDLEKMIAELMGNSEEAAPEEAKPLTQADIDRLVEEKLSAKLQEVESKKLETTTVENFKKSIKESVSANAEKFPLLDATGNTDLVYQVIEQDYARNVEEYGEDWANENILDIEKAAEMVQNNLDKEFKALLGSDHVKKLVLSHYGLSDINGQTRQQVQTDIPNTLTKEFSAANNVPADDKNLTDEERFNRALSLL